MAFAFLPWTNISDTFTGVPGGPVAVVPWGNHFALFATDNTGTVRCAGAISVLSANGVPVESIALLAGHDRTATTESV